MIVYYPKNVKELLPLAGKLVLVNKAIYGVLSINLLSNKFMILSPDLTPEPKYALDLKGSEIFEEVTEGNYRSMGILGKFDDLEIWPTAIDWGVLGENWVYSPTKPTDFSQQWDKETGELVKTPYNKNGGFNFL